MKDDFSALRQMKYSGRGITFGMTPRGETFAGYTLTGRSPPSQARTLEKSAQTVYTEVTDRQQLEEGSPALLIYPALVCLDGTFIASNGAQTKLLYDHLARGRAGALIATEYKIDVFSRPAWEFDKKDGRWINITTYEPDREKTSRINGTAAGNKASFFIISFDGERERQQYISIDLGPGFASTITTYSGGNEQPRLQPFSGKPVKAEVEYIFAQDLCDSLYDSIQHGEKPDENFGVAAAVMLMKKDGRLDIATRNRFQKVRE